MENVHDWCISRQLWWGHRIPAWYCDDCGEDHRQPRGSDKCEKCGSTHLTRTRTCSIPGSPPRCGRSPRSAGRIRPKTWSTSIPTAVLVTGYDIIFFWVARMIFSGMEQMGEGARSRRSSSTAWSATRKGRKMSKSLGNGIDPLEVIDKYGADALRFTSSPATAPATTCASRTRSARPCATSPTRSGTPPLRPDEPDHRQGQGSCSEQTLSHRGQVDPQQAEHAGREVTANMDAYELGVAAAKLTTSSGRPIATGISRLPRPVCSRRGERSAEVLVLCADRVLQLLHPFMPFITERSGRRCRMRASSLWYPHGRSTRRLHFAAEEAQMESLMDAVRAIRNRRAEMNAGGGGGGGGNWGENI